MDGVFLKSASQPLHSLGLLLPKHKVSIAFFLTDSYTSPNLEIPTTLPSDREQLHSLRKNIAMELLWVQQAINSRKNVSKSQINHLITLLLASWADLC